MGVGVGIVSSGVLCASAVRSVVLRRALFNWSSVVRQLRFPTNNAVAVNSTAGSPVLLASSWLVLLAPPAPPVPPVPPASLLLLVATPLLLLATPVPPVPPVPSVPPAPLLLLLLASKASFAKLLAMHASLRGEPQAASSRPPFVAAAVLSLHASGMPGGAQSFAAAVGRVRATLLDPSGAPWLSAVANWPYRTNNRIAAAASFWVSLEWEEAVSGDGPAAVMAAASSSTWAVTDPARSAHMEPSRTQDCRVGKRRIRSSRWPVPGRALGVWIAVGWARWDTWDTKQRHASEVARECAGGSVVDLSSHDRARGLHPSYPPRIKCSAPFPRRCC